MAIHEMQGSVFPRDSSVCRELAQVAGLVGPASLRSSPIWRCTAHSRLGLQERHFVTHQASRVCDGKIITRCLSKSNHWPVLW